MYTVPSAAQFHLRSDSRYLPCTIPDSIHHPYSHRDPPHLHPSLPTLPPVFSVPQSMAFKLFLDLQRHNAAPSHLLYLHSNPKAHIASVALFLGMKPCCCSLIFAAVISLAHATLPQLHCWFITFIPLKLPQLF